MKTKIIIAALAVLSVAVIAAIWMRRSSEWDFVRTVTDFDFPAGTEYLAQYDNAEWFVVSVVRLPAGAVSKFVRDHHFTADGRHSMTTALSLPEPYRTVPNRPDVLSTSGQNAYQAWDAVLDPRSGLLWIHVAYPDWSGDHPGTAPQPPNTTRGK